MIKKYYLRSSFSCGKTIDPHSIWLQLRGTKYSSHTKYKMH